VRSVTETPERPSGQGPDLHQPEPTRRHTVDVRGPRPDTRARAHRQEDGPAVFGGPERELPVRHRYRNAGKVSRPAAPPAPARGPIGTVPTQEAQGLTPVRGPADKNAGPPSLVVPGTRV